MSDNAELQSQKPEVEQEKEVDIVSLQKENEFLQRNRVRLEEESKSWKAKYQGMKSDVEEQETNKLQEDNNFQGLYEKAQAENARLKESANASRKVELENSLKYEVAKNAKDADDMDILLAAIKAKKSDHLAYNREGEKWEGVDSAIEDLRKSNPGLFMNDRPGMINGRPQAAVPKEKTVNELIEEDARSVLTNSLEELLKTK